MLGERHKIYVTPILLVSPVFSIIFVIEPPLQFVSLPITQRFINFVVLFFPAFERFNYVISSIPVMIKTCVDNDHEESIKVAASCIRIFMIKQ